VSISGYDVLGQGSDPIGTGTGTVTVVCHAPTGKVVLGGGYTLTDSLTGDQVKGSYPDGQTGWQVVIEKNATNSGSVTVFAVVATA
jgi:hypothetical protein